MSIDLFDASYYRAANSDLAGLNDSEAWSHFQNYGLDEGRRFSPLANLGFYRASNADLANFNNRQAYDHLQNYGVMEGRDFSPLVDLDFYRAANGDLGGLNNAQLLDHLTMYGVNEGRNFSPLVGLDFYRTANSDLASFNNEQLLDHLTLYGITEGRRFSSFVDLNIYLEENLDINQAFTGNRSQALQHLAIHGLKEGRDFSVTFDTDYYRSANSDLQAFSNHQLLEHFQLWGLGEGRSASEPFQVRAYLEKNPDLQAAGFNYSQAHQHYLFYGQYEDRFSTYERFNIQFDYRFDTNGWFTPEKKAVLEAAANVWENIIQEVFKDTPIGTNTPYVINPQTGQYAGTDNTFTTDLVIDDLLIFAGARELDVLARGGPSGWDTNETRYTGADFEPWIGSVVFDTSTNWFFDLSPDTHHDIPSSSSDFLSVAVHEIGHVLGFTKGIKVFDSLVNNNTFIGSNAKQQNGGNPVPLDSYGHIQDDYQFGNTGENAMDSFIDYGNRALPTVLDIAFLDDIGYTVDYNAAYHNSFVTLTSPNAANTLEPGSLYEITWNDNLSENVSLYLYKGSSLVHTVADSTESDGSYSWRVPSSSPKSGDDYKIKIQSVLNSSLSDTSDTSFTIGKHIYITFPYTDSITEEYEGFYINWWHNLDENVQIDLYKDNNYLQTIATSTPSDGSYYWYFPSNLIAGNHYQIKVSSILDAEANDYSGTFAIPSYIRLDSPIKDDTVTPGTSQTITWADNITEQVSIDLYESFSLVSNITPGTASDGSYDWNVPADLPAGDKYSIRITSTSDSSFFDYDQLGNFSVIGQVTVDSLNGGNPLTVGDSYTINWSDNLSEDIKIELYKGAEYDQTIVSSTASDGSYEWTVPADLAVGDDYQIRVVSTIDNSIVDSSDSNFSIQNRLLSKFDFNGDGNEDIFWRNYGNPGGSPSKIWLLDGNGGKIGEIDGPGSDIAPSSDPAQFPSVAADFNQDGQKDIVWRYYWGNEIGDNRLWLMNGSEVLEEVFLRQVPDLDWHLVGAGDFNGDQNPDLVWRNYATGAVHIWRMDGTNYVDSAFLPTDTNIDNKIVGTGDFNQDGNLDILWRNIATGRNYLWLMDGVNYAATVDIQSLPANYNWRIVGTGDYNSDNKVDILWRHDQSGENSFWIMDGTEYAGYQSLPTWNDPNWQIAGQADPIPVWKAEFFNNTDLSGDPVVVESLGTSVYHTQVGGFKADWGNGSTDGAALGYDNFSSRITTKRYFAPGLYKVSAHSDDGVTVKVGDKSLINQWDSLGRFAGYFKSDGAYYPVEVKHREFGGLAYIDLDISAVSAFDDQPYSGGSWDTRVYNTSGNPPVDLNGLDLIGRLSLGSDTRSDGKKGIQAYWGQGAPNGDSRLPHDWFAILSYTQADFDGSEYNFRVLGDDRIQIFAKNIHTNQWYWITPENQWVSSYGFSDYQKALPAGRYDVHFRMFENGGDAHIDLSWTKAGVAYYNELSSWSDAQWDWAAGDNTRITGAFWSGETNETNYSGHSAILGIYNDLSRTLVGQDYRSSAGYAADASYLSGLGWYHQGIDIDTPNDVTTNVKALVSGVVTRTFTSDGLWVDIAGDDGRFYRYGHLKREDVNIGSRISAGQVIGAVGNSNPSNHLHFQVTETDVSNRRSGYSIYNQSHVYEWTMNPLKVFWELKHDGVI